jgi:hypothetical protein
MFGEQLQQTFTAFVIYHFCLLLFCVYSSSPAGFIRRRCQVITLLTIETNHFGLTSQSSFAQLLDYFRRIAA